jgi:hypothetical protein
MSTEAQINANRENAQKSTGPKSPEGKAAVSQNAVKHGVFASETVIKGENREDFEAFRDEMLGELAPAGPVETMLCERFVSLSWRLRRVERMQNQVIDVMIARDEPRPLTRRFKPLRPELLRDVHDDPRGASPELVLGRAVIKDYSDSRVLDRLSLYERRIEHSMFKTMRELRNLRVVREMQQAEAAQTDEANRAKQSQFERAQMNVRLVSREDYENARALRLGQNKPKQSQFAAHLRRPNRHNCTPATPKSSSPRVVASQIHAGP